MEGRNEGWYPDPVQVGGARYWDGSRWTDRVSFGGRVVRDATPVAAVARQEAESNAAIIRGYIDDAVVRGVLDQPVAEVVRTDLDTLMAAVPTRPLRRATWATATATAASTAVAASGRAVPTAATIPTAATVPTAATAPTAPMDLSTLPPPAPTATPIGTPSAVTGLPEPRPAMAGARWSPSERAFHEPVPVQPGRLAAWWSDAHHAVRSDVALHGLAYLGVLLLLAGVTGLIVFSFADVAPWVRSLTESLLPMALFGSAWYLGRRGAAVVAAALVVLGGAITPIVVAASLSDGAPIPPDLHGPALPLVQGLSVALVAVAMALVVRRTPSSALRYLVAPALWLAVGLTVGVTRSPAPTGYTIARFDDLQLAAMIAAITATVWGCSSRRLATAVPVRTLAVVRSTGLLAAAALGLLELLVAGRAGWPAAGTAVVGISAVLLLEAASRNLPPVAVSAGQLATVVVIAARSTVHLEPLPVAVATAWVLLGLVEYQGRRRPSMPACVGGLLLSAAAFLLTITDSAWTVACFSVLAGWALWRHRVPAPWLPGQDRHGVVAAIAASVAVAAAWTLVDRQTALIVTASLVLAGATLGRLWRPVRDDDLWRWFTPVAALAVCAASAWSWGDLSVAVAVTGALAAAAMALSAVTVGPRLWATVALTIWSLANAAAALHLGRDLQAELLAGAALLAIVIALVVARPVCANVLAIGHVVAAAALVVPVWPGWATVGVLAAATAGWLAVAVVEERGGAVHLDALRAGLASHAAGVDAPVPADADTGTTATIEAGPGTTVTSDADPGIDHLALLLSFAGLEATVLTAADLTGRATIGDPWAAVVGAGVALFGAALVRVVPWRRARRSVLATVTVLSVWVTALIAVAEIGAVRSHWEPVLCLGAGLLAVGLMTAPRPTPIGWAWWLNVAFLVGFLADRAGIERNRIELVIAAWGALVLVGALGVNRSRHGARSPGTYPTDRLLLPPIVQGAVAFVCGGVLGLADVDPHVAGWTAAAMAAVVLVVALLMPLAVLVAGAELLATAAYVLLAPWQPAERPWTLVPVVLALLLVALATRRDGPASVTRWDLPSFLVAHAVALGALAVAPATASIVPTYGALAAVALAVAIVLRRPHWAAAGAVLLLVTGIDAGRGWLALVLLLEGAVFTAGALRVQRDMLRWALGGLGAAALIGAWFDLAAWLQWSAPTVYFATVPAALVLAVGAAVLLRRGTGPLQIAVVWTVGGTLTAGGTVLTLLAEVERRPGGLVLGAAVLGLAAVSAILTPRLTLLRWATPELLAGAALPAAWAVELDPAVMVLLAIAAALSTLIAAVVGRARRPAATWPRPAAAYAVTTQLFGLVAAVGLLPQRHLLIAALLAASAELVALAIVTDLPRLHLPAPVLACAAWLVYAADALRGDANWFTVPIGLTLLVVVALVRWIRRARALNASAPEIVLLEFVGMALLVGAALADTLAGRLWYAVLAIAVGMAITAWGTITRVVWRAAFGAGAVVVATVAVIGVPLARQADRQGPGLWIAISAVGLTAIVVAVAIESSRDRLRLLAHRLGDMTADWERLTATRPPEPRSPGDSGAVTPGTPATPPPQTPPAATPLPPPIAPPGTA